eukprot:TRINITY_DN7860_c0_g1_i3.p1 TRINITY_DN7860_c0_g1~~TRINITY_DN7860_c0_g1_i3.p1  ORF type:complete len:160 (-),score=33.57 TRINITY_DN7860_c0_g1_i3:60-539(-)
MRGPAYQVNQYLELSFNATKEVRLLGFSPTHHTQNFELHKKSWFSNEYQIWIPLKEPAIHIWRILADGNQTVLPGIPTIHFFGTAYNVAVVGYNYSIQLVQSLYHLLEKVKNKQLVVHDLEEFLSKYQDFQINSKFVCLQFLLLKCDSVLGYICMFVLY